MKKLGIISIIFALLFVFISVPVLAQNSSGNSDSTTATVTGSTDSSANSSINDSGSGYDFKDAAGKLGSVIVDDGRGALLIIILILGLLLV